MVEKTPQELIEEHIKKGAILAVLYFDVHANNKEAVHPTLVELVSKLTREFGVISSVGELDEPIENNGMWSSSAEVTVLMRDFSSLSNLCIRYGPIGVEVIKPDQIKLDLGEAQRTLLNISQIGQEFANYVITKVMSKDEKAAFDRKMAAKADIGKKLMEKKGDDAAIIGKKEGKKDD